MEKFVSCVTKEQCSAVIQRMVAEGCRPINPDHAWDSYSKEVVIRKNNDKHISYADRQWYTDHGYGGRIITAYQYLNKTNKPILITRKGRVVTAEDKNTGEKAIATCCPTDEFDFGTGAMIAVARLMAKTSEVLTDDVRAEWKKVLGIKGVEKGAYTDVDRNFKVGDRVEIKTWDEMEKAYRLNPWGSIFHGGTYFAVPMKHLCGRTATITEIINDRFELDFDNKSGDVVWYYMDWMLKKSNKPKPEVTEIEVGDTVRITNSGYSYTTFIDWIHDNVTDFRNAVLFDYNVIPKNGTVCTVIKKGKHIIEGNMLYYVKTDNDKCYLIGEGGIEKV